MKQYRMSAPSICVLGRPKKGDHHEIMPRRRVCRIRARTPSTWALPMPLAWQSCLNREFSQISAILNRLVAPQLVDGNVQSPDTESQEQSLTLDVR